ncbi:MAG: hypothetical protein J1E64_01865 [Acetatifactor sp.]|nr:hypothetical protein [Acetatifactor sp.]
MQESRTVLSKKIGYFVFILIGSVFVFFWMTQKDLAEQENILWTGSYVARLLGISLFVGALLGGTLCFFLYALAEGVWRKLLFRENSLFRDARRVGVRLEGLGIGKVYLFSFLLIALSWIPTYLAYYPAICAYDAPIQVGQAVEDYLVDHHPLVHTLLIRGFIYLGRGVFGDVNVGIGIYAVLQLLFLSAAFAYGIAALHRFHVRPLWQVLALLYCMFYPFHWYMSVTVTKDTVFTGFVVVMMVSMCELLLEGRNDLRVKGRDVLLFVAVMGVILFRNNGKYALMVMLVILFLALIVGRTTRRLWARILGNVLVAFLLGNVILSAVFTLSGAEQGDRREMLSMPIQQLARTMIYHGGVGVLPEDDDTMEDVDRALINDFLLDEAYRWYDADLADPVKAHTNTYVVRYRYEDFFSTYFHLLSEYPGDFINAGLAVNAGYLYPNDVSHAYINEQEGLVGRGYVQTYWFEADLVPRGIYKDSKWESLREALESWADRNAYLYLPVLKYIFVPGTYLYLYLILAGYLLIRREWRMLVPLAFVLGHYITLFLGPTVQLRYLYPVMVGWPFMALLHGKFENSAKG